MTKTEYLDKNIVTWLSFILSSGEGGHRQPIVSITDDKGVKPSEANNYLLNDSGTEFAGIFRNNTAQSFDFTITKNGDGWTRSFRPSSKVENNVK